MKTVVLYIVPSSGIGGAETFIKNLFLVRENSAYSPVFILFRKGPLYDWLVEHNASVELIAHTPPRLSRPWDFYKTHLCICKIIEKYKPALIHSTMAYGALFTAWAAYQKKIPHIWFQHGPASGWMDQMAALFPHRAVLVNSLYTEHAQKKLEEPINWLIPKTRSMHKIPLGTSAPKVDQNRIGDTRKNLLSSFHLSEETVLIAMACRIQKWKGVDLLLEAARLLKKREISFFIFVWGEAFDSAEYFQNLVSKAKGLPVSFQGVADDVSLAFASCDIIVNASLQPEPFGLTLIEALAAGKPVIAPDEGGPLEILSEGKYGCLFKARSAESLATTLEHLIRDSQSRISLGNLAKERYNKSFTLVTMIRTLDEVYNQTIKSM